MLYLASLIRSVLALHDLIDNKQARQWYEKERLAKEEAAKAEKAGGKKAAAGGEAAPAAEGGAAADGGEKKGEDGKQ